MSFYCLKRKILSNIGNLFIEKGLTLYDEVLIMRMFL